MSDERTAEVVMAAWRSCFHATPDAEREKAIEALISKPRYSEDGKLTSPGGRYHDIDQRIASVGKLIEWRRSQSKLPRAAWPDTDDVARLAAEDGYASGLHRYLTFLTMDLRTAVGTELLNGGEVQ